MEIYEALRADFARFIHAQPDEVAIVTSASAGINPIASALRFDERNKVVMSEYEFPTMGHIWLAQRPRGASQIWPMVGNSYSLITTLLRSSNRSALAIGLIPAEALVTMATSSGCAWMKRAKAARSAS